MRHGRTHPTAAIISDVLGLPLALLGFAYYGSTNHFDPDRERKIESVAKRFDFINPRG